jgi:NTP pyrophosphatase (non-canonical NTP hydrolase)
MDIEKEIKENYEIAKSKGFYPEDSKIEDHLMGIVSELGEAYEAHRGGKFAFVGLYNEDSLDYFITHKYKEAQYIKHYKNYLSGTFEDEIADVFIRLFNLCGWLNIDVDSKLFKEGYIINRGTFETVGELLNISNCMDNIRGNKILKKKSDGTIGYILSRLESLCEKLNIPIEKHIQAKKEYNKTRPQLHGKKY